MLSAPTQLLPNRHNLMQSNQSTTPSKPVQKDAEAFTTEKKFRCSEEVQTPPRSTEEKVGLLTFLYPTPDGVFNQGRSSGSTLIQPSIKSNHIDLEKVCLSMYILSLAHLLTLKNQVRKSPIINVQL